MGENFIEGSGLAIQCLPLMTATTLDQWTQDTAPSLGALLRDTVRNHGEKVAVMIPGKEGFRSLTYLEFYARVARHAAALRSLGLQRGDRIAIMAENSVDWSLTDWASQCLGIVPATIFPTLPADQAIEIVADSEAKVAVVGTEDHRSRLSGHPGLKILTLHELEEIAGSQTPLSEADLDREIDLADPADLATLIYTSGTSGQPKGVMLSHRAMTWVGKAILAYLPVSKDDLFVSFLPMSHCFERIDGQILPISLGATVAYSKNLASLAGDILKAKPTVLLVVPRFLENIRDRIQDGVAKQSSINQALFRLGLSQGLQKAKGKPAPLFFLTDRLVGQKIRARFGGRLRLVASGGAALDKDVSLFFEAFGIRVLQGYGLTETSAGISINTPDRNKHHTVGEVLPGMECRIAEDGEILLRGHAVMDGYYKRPEETAAAIDADGWFHTGDIGEFEGKHLKITDRKKDLIVLGNGKNVAPQPIENRLKQSRFIAEAVVLGDGMDHCVALIVPNAEAVRTELGLGEGISVKDSPEAKALIKKEIDRINKTLANFEMVKKHALLETVFSVESGELTPSLKVKRRVITERYATEIASLTR